jgi:S-adenosyl-L-methionine hydrolase (adenosine-forming)
MPYPKYDRLSAAFLTISSFHHFPKGTVHFLGLDSGGGRSPIEAADYLVLRYRDHFFLGADSGVFSMLVQGRPFESWILPIAKDIALRELFPRLAAALVELASGKEPSTLGSTNTKLLECSIPGPSSDSSGIRCSVIYVDTFGNAVFNLGRGLFEKERGGRSFTVLVRNASYRINRICQHYNEVEEGDLLAIFNQNDFLEIALNKGDASRLLGIKLYDSILIEFHDHTNRQDAVPNGD